MKSCCVLPLLLLLGCAMASCGSVSSDPGDGDTDDTATPDGADTLIDTGPDTTPDTAVDTADDTLVPDTAEDTAEDVVEEVTPWCEDDGGYCTTYPGSDPCVTCEDVGGTHYQPAREHEGAMECTATGGDEPYCCLPVDASDPAECETGGGECYRRGGADGLVCPVGWVEETTMSCRGGRTCCVPGPDCP